MLQVLVMYKQNISQWYLKYFLTNIIPSYIFQGNGTSMLRCYQEWNFSVKIDENVKKKGSKMMYISKILNFEGLDSHS